MGSIKRSFAFTQDVHTIIYDYQNMYDFFKKLHEDMCALHVAPKVKTEDGIYTMNYYDLPFNNEDLYKYFKKYNVKKEIVEEVLYFAFLQDYYFHDVGLNKRFKKTVDMYRPPIICFDKIDNLNNNMDEKRLLLIILNRLNTRMRSSSMFDIGLGINENGFERYPSKNKLTDYTFKLSSVEYFDGKPTKYNTSDNFTVKGVNFHGKISVSTNDINNNIDILFKSEEGEKLQKILTNTKQNRGYVLSVKVKEPDTDNVIEIYFLILLESFINKYVSDYAIINDFIKNLKEK